MTEINIEGLTEVKSFLKKKKKNVEKEIKNSMAKAAILVQGNVKKSIAGQEAEPKSVDTGRFLNSVEVDVGDDDATIFSNLSYAEVLEYGSSSRVARNHFNNSAARSEDGVKKILTTNLKDI